MRQKKKKKLGVAVVLLANVFFGGGGKCPNLGVVNVRILGVVNVLLANDSQSEKHEGGRELARYYFFFTKKACVSLGLRYYGQRAQTILQKSEKGCR